MVSVRFCFGITVVDGGEMGGRERISIQHFREYFKYCKTVNLLLALTFIKLHLV